MKSSAQRNALIACAALAVLAACSSGRTVGPLIPLTSPLLLPNGSSTSPCPTIFVISPAQTFSDVAERDLTLTEALEKRQLEYRRGCVVVSRSHPPAKWSATSGSLHVEDRSTRAIFSGSEFGIYGIDATSGIYSASAAVVIQRDKEQLLARLRNPAAGGLLMDASGALYGVTDTSGTVFKLVRGASHVETIYTFQGGHNPSGALIADKRGDLFGTTGIGIGTAYELERSGNDYTERVLHRFVGGGGPMTGLVADHNGTLYGTTDGGIVFKLTPTGKSYAYTILHRFKIKHVIFNGLSRLVEGGDGSFYGTVEGYTGFGFVYKLTPKGSSVHTIYSFKGSTDGYNPLGDIVVDTKGVLYGTTVQGGVFGGGTIFDLTPSRSGFDEHILHSFDGLHGAGPTGLTAGPNGMLYGVTNGGGGGNGILFAFDRLTQKESTVYFFERRYAPVRPYFSPITDATGALYGVWAAPLGGSSIVYKVKP